MSGWKKTAWLTGAFAVAMVSISAYRAATFPFVHDECLSYLIHHDQPKWAHDANNHLLNTWLIYMWSHMLGHSEAFLRLHSVAGHLIYTIASAGAVAQLRSRVIAICAFAALNLNLFVLDFFFLARGYGLGLAMEMASITLLLRATAVREELARARWIAASLSCAAIAVLANFTFINFLIPAVAVGVWGALNGNSLRLPTRRGFVVATSTLAGILVFLAPIVSRLLALRDRDGLYVGGDGSLFAEVLGSLVSVSLYGLALSSSLLTPLSVVVAAGCALAIGLMIYRFIKRRTVLAEDIPAILLLFAAGVTVGQRLVLGNPYPHERTALFYIPLIASTLAFLLDAAAADVVSRRLRATALGVAVLFGLLAVCVWTLRLDTKGCWTWHYDAHGPAVIEAIDRDRKVHFPGQRIIVRNNWLFEPSLNFYRLTGGHDWLAPLTRDSLLMGAPHYMYVLPDDLEKLGGTRVEEIARFPRNGARLLRARPGTAGGGPP